MLLNSEQRTSHFVCVTKMSSEYSIGKCYKVQISIADVILTNVNTLKSISIRHPDFIKVLDYTWDMERLENGFISAEDLHYETQRGGEIVVISEDTCIKPSEFKGFKMTGVYRYDPERLKVLYFEGTNVVTEVLRDHVKGLRKFMQAYVEQNKK